MASDAGHALLVRHLAVGVEPPGSDLEGFRDESADAADSHAVEFALSCLDLVKSGGCHRTGADDNPDDGRGYGLLECDAVMGCRVGSDDIGAGDKRDRASTAPSSAGLSV